MIKTREHHRGDKRQEFLIEDSRSVENVFSRAEKEWDRFHLSPRGTEYSVYSTVQRLLYYLTPLE